MNTHAEPLNPYSREAHYLRYGSPNRARFILFAIFLAYCAVDYVSFPSIAIAERQTVAGALVIQTLWLAVLFGAIWCRQHWARYTVCILLSLEVVLGFILLWNLGKASHPLAFAIWLTVVTNLVTILLLTFLSSMNMLTRRR